VRILDLSQPLGTRTARSSDHPQVDFQTLRWYSRDGMKTHKITASLHSGTHVDAPALYFSGGLTIDQLPLDGFWGTGVVVDIGLGERGVISGDHLDKVAKDVREGDIMAMYTGFSKHYLDEELYVLKAPGLDKSGADWVVDHKLKAVWVDTPSAEHIFSRQRQWKLLRPDLFPDALFDPKDFPGAYAHKVLLPAGIMMVENVSEELGQLVGQRVTLMALPAKYQGVEGAPCRAVALLDDQSRVAQPAPDAAGAA
jgi:kynurenine formamidase